MSPPEPIQFHPVSSSAMDFVHELNDPDILRNRRMPPRAAIEIRRQQVARLKQNVQVLVAKRDEFNRKMEEYIQNLTALTRSIEKRIANETRDLGGPGASLTQRGTRVQCLLCESEAVFQHLEIIFARESDESFTLPTEVYVLDADGIKKGHFACGACGKENLVIRAG